MKEVRNFQANDQLKGIPQKAPIFALTLTSDRNFLLSGGEDPAVNLWNPSTGLLIKSFHAQSHEVRDIQVTRDNSKLFTCGGDRCAFIIDVEKGRIVRKFGIHTHCVMSLALDESENVAVTGGKDRMMKLWDIRTRGPPVQEFKDCKDTILFVDFPQPTTIFCGSADDSVYEYDFRKGECMVTRLQGPVSHVSLCMNSKYFLATCVGSDIFFCDRATGEVITFFQGAKRDEFPGRSYFNQGETLIYSTSECGNLYSWTFERDLVMKVIPVSEVPILASVMGGNALITGDTQGCIRVFNTA